MGRTTRPSRLYNFFKTSKLLSQFFGVWFQLLGFLSGLEATVLQSAIVAEGMIVVETVIMKIAPHVMIESTPPSRSRSRLQVIFM